MENYKANKIGEVKGLGVIYQAFAPLPEQISALQKEGVEYPFLVTPEDACAIRIAGLFDDYTRTCIAPIGVKGEKPILYKPSPLMNILMARIAVKSHSDGKYPAFGREFYEFAKETANAQLSLEPEDRTAQILSNSEDYDLTPEMDDTKFALGRHASEYFKKFGHSKISLFNLPTNNLPKDKCIVNYLWFCRPSSGSNLYCRNRLLDDAISAFGVRKSAKGAAKNLEQYFGKVKQAREVYIERLKAIRNSIDKELRTAR